MADDFSDFVCAPIGGHGLVAATSRWSGIKAKQAGQQRRSGAGDSEIFKDSYYYFEWKSTNFGSLLK